MTSAVPDPGGRVPPQQGSPWKQGSLEGALYHYTQAGQPNPVRLHVPAHERLRVPRLGELVPTPLPPAVRAQVARMDPGTYVQFEDWRWWSGPRQLTVACSIDLSTDHGDLMHLSASHPNKLPTWEEMTALRDFFFGQLVDVAMLLPRRVDWVNLHDYCFHLWQVPVEWGLR